MIKGTAVVRALCVAIAAFAALSTATRASAGALGNLAASMQPGTFAELTGMNGWDAGGILVPTDLGCSANDYITQYAEKAAWDPVGQRLLFVGHTHGNCYGGRFVLFNEATNTWSKGPWPQGVCQSGSADSPCFSHAYGHNTTDPATGDLYFRQSYTMKFFRYRNGAWASIPAPPTQSSQCCGALEYFPDMNRLLFLDGDWGLWAFNPASSTWTALANTTASNAVPGLPNLAMPSTVVFAQYNPASRSLLFGGGSNLYKINGSGTITTLKSPPVGLGVTHAVLSVDPASGKYIVLSGSAMYQYDATADSWGQLSASVPAVFRSLLGVGDGLVATPIKQHGVIAYIKYDFGNSKVYLYKHAPFVPPVAPKPPSNVTAQ
jgi:hypothetical protein